MTVSKATMQALTWARDNAEHIARKNAEDYIKWNPQDKDRRIKELQCELIGIHNMYYRAVEQFEMGGI